MSESNHLRPFTVCFRIDLPTGHIFTEGVFLSISTGHLNESLKNIESLRVFHIKEGIHYFDAISKAEPSMNPIPLTPEQKEEVYQSFKGQIILDYGPFSEMDPDRADWFYTSLGILKATLDGMPDVAINHKPQH